MRSLRRCVIVSIALFASLVIYLTKKYLNIGLTGDIGSGKSTVLSLFSELGAKVISADLIARQLTQPGSFALEKMTSFLGVGILTQQGELNRRLLRNKICEDTELRRWLENLLHPLIRRELERQVLMQLQLYAVVEIPLLLNKQDYPYLDSILLVDAPEEIKIQRLMQRDQMEATQAKAMLSIQPDIQIRYQVADDIIMNYGDLDELRQQVILLHQEFLARLI